MQLFVSKINHHLLLSQKVKTTGKTENFYVSAEKRKELLLFLMSLPQARSFLKSPKNLFCVKVLSRGWNFVYFRIFVILLRHLVYSNGKSATTKVFANSYNFLHKLLLYLEHNSMLLASITGNQIRVRCCTFIFMWNGQIDCKSWWKLFKINPFMVFKITEA